MKGNCTVSMSDADFMNLVTGKLGPQKVIMGPERERERERGRGGGREGGRE